MQQHIYYAKYALQFADMQIPELVTVFNTQVQNREMIDNVWHISSQDRLSQLRDKLSQLRIQLCWWLAKMGKNRKKRHHSTQSSETPIYFAVCGVLSKDSTNTPPTLPLQDGSKELLYGFVNEERQGGYLGGVLVESWWGLKATLHTSETPL